MDRILAKLKNERNRVEIMGIIITALGMTLGFNLQSAAGTWLVIGSFFIGMSAVIFAYYSKYYNNLKALLLKAIILPAIYLGIHPLLDLLKLNRFDRVINMMAMFLAFYILNNYNREDTQPKESLLTNSGRKN